MTPLVLTIFCDRLLITNEDTGSPARSGDFPRVRKHTDITHDTTSVAAPSLFVLSPVLSCKEKQWQFYGNCYFERWHSLHCESILPQPGLSNKTFYKLFMIWVLVYSLDYGKHSMTCIICFVIKKQWLILISSLFKDKLLNCTLTSEPQQWLFLVQGYTTEILKSSIFVRESCGLTNTPWKFNLVLCFPPFPQCSTGHNSKQKIFLPFSTLSNFNSFSNSQYHKHYWSKAIIYIPSSLVQEYTNLLLPLVGFLILR